MRNTEAQAGKNERPSAPLLRRINLLDITFPVISLGMNSRLLMLIAAGDSLLKQVSPPLPENLTL